MMDMEETGLQAWARERLGHAFLRIDILIEALTHTTYTNEHPQAPSNQRLEFLGDALVGMVVADYLFRQFPDLSEGDLTKIRAAVVCEPSLAECARSLQTGSWMRFGRGEAASGHERDSILADVFEALVGALFLDAGLETTRQFVLGELVPLVDITRQGQMRVDHKTRLQELLQREFTEGPTYRLLAEEGPAHSKRFQVGVFHRSTQLGDGWGKNKKEAEQEAARQALAFLSRP